MANLITKYRDLIVAIALVLAPILFSFFVWLGAETLKEVKTEIKILQTSTIELQSETTQALGLIQSSITDTKEDVEDVKEGLSDLRENFVNLSNDVSAHSALINLQFRDRPPDSDDEQ